MKAPVVLPYPPSKWTDDRFVHEVRHELAENLLALAYALRYDDCDRLQISELIRQMAWEIKP